MPRVFTIYNCGTCQNRQDLNELVANLANRTVGAENRDWLINDGPGAAPMAHPAGAVTTVVTKGVAKNGPVAASSSQWAAVASDGRAVARAGAAAFNPKPTGPLVTPHERALAAQAHLPGTRNPETGQSKGILANVFQKLRGVVTGSGWDENVAHTLAVLQALCAGSATPPQVVNLIGWSRGAVTCHRIAHAMTQDTTLAKIEVNIFALDPVPGTGNRTKGDWDKMSIPKSVKHYVAVLMEHESRFIMKPVDATVLPKAPGTQRTLYTMPGVHGTGAMIHQDPVAEIVQHLAHEFLRKHGTQLTGAIQLTPLRLCELYAMMRLNLKRYEAMRQKGPWHYREGDFANPMRSTVYVNQHHCDMFRSAYPQLANNGYRTLEQQKVAIDGLRATAPASQRWLREVCGLGR